MKTCSICKNTKEEKEFSLVKSFRKGKTYTSCLKYCKQCKHKKDKEYRDKPEVKIKNKQYQEKYRASNLEKNKLYQIDYRKNNKTKIQKLNKKYRAANKEKLANQKKEWYEANKIKILFKVRTYRKFYRARPETKALRAEYQVRRNRLINLATPPWANLNKIKEIYLQAQIKSKETGILYHVDHIIPLKGKEVCGLHVEKNLRVIRAVDNIRKSNNLEVDTLFSYVSNN